MVAPSLIAIEKWLRDKQGHFWIERDTKELMEALGKYIGEVERTVRATSARVVQQIGKDNG